MEIKQQEYTYWFIKSKTMSGDNDGRIQTTFRLPTNLGNSDGTFHAYENKIRLLKN